MNRLTLRNNIRARLRQLNADPFTDDDINASIEMGVDTLTARVPFCMATDYGNSVKGQREYILDTNVQSVISVTYQPGASSVLASGINSSADTLTLFLTSSGDNITETGFIKIDDEVIQYSGKTGSDPITLSNLIRGQRGTQAASHSAFADVQQVTTKASLIEAQSIGTFNFYDDSWVSSEPGIPEKCYVENNILGFDVPLPFDGYRNIVLKTLVRPPTMANDNDVILGLKESEYNIITNWVCYDLAIRLAQDDASSIQANIWYKDYLAGVDMLKRSKVRLTPLTRQQLIPSNEQ